MLVKELRELLAAYDGNTEVILQKDPEGNGYRHIRGVDGDCAYGHNGYGLYVISTNESAEDLEIDEQHYEALLKNRCVVLYP